MKAKIQPTPQSMEGVESVTAPAPVPVLVSPMAKPKDQKKLPQGGPERWPGVCTRRASCRAPHSERGNQPAIRGCYWGGSAGGWRCCCKATANTYPCDMCPCESQLDHLAPIWWSQTCRAVGAAHVTGKADRTSAETTSPSTQHPLPK